MKLRIESGFYKYFPDYVGEIKLYEQRTGLKLYPMRNFWTFQILTLLPNYSFKNHKLIGEIKGIVNYAGLPEEVLTKNQLTYNVKNGTITDRAEASLQTLDFANGAFLTFPTLPQAYARDADKQQITGLEAFVDARLGMYKVERLVYEDF